jgi:hypothetical protein
MTSILETEITSRERLLKQTERSEPIEITLPETSIFRKLIEKPIDDNVKEVDSTITDEEYNQMMKEFLERIRKQNVFNKPENKIKRILKAKEEERKRKF